jgi:hypothetical protein
MGERLQTPPERRITRQPPTAHGVPTTSAILAAHVRWSSSKCAPVRSSGVTWSDTENDMPALHPTPCRPGMWRSAEPAPRGRRTPWHHPTERQRLHRPKQGGTQGVLRACDQKKPGLTCLCVQVDLSDRRPSDYESWSTCPASAGGSSWLLTSPGSSVECAPDQGRYSPWNDHGNDHRSRLCISFDGSKRAIPS